MDKKLKQKWIDALQSGKYQKCESKLHIPANMTVNNQEKFCALGVLADIMGLIPKNGDPASPDVIYNELGKVLGGETVGKIYHISDNSFFKEEYRVKPDENPFIRVVEYIEQNIE